jgi:hypothetical protein
MITARQIFRIRRRLRVFIAELLFCLGAFVAMLLGMWMCIVLLTSDWEYRLVNNEAKMAYFVRLPGYREYIQLDHEPPVVRKKFSMRAYYRVSPWYDPEDKDAE